MIEDLKSEFFECQCHSDEHTLKFTWNEEDNEIYTSVFLDDYRNFFQRVKVAAKYIFGYKCKYGHWDCFVLKPEDAGRLKELLEKLNNK